MTETRKRLEEANYFLDRMKETLDKPNASTELGNFAFRCDINAFLSFARSVTTLPKPFPKNHRFVMENEYGKRQGFRVWYEQQMQNDDIAMFFATQRNISIHEKSIQPHGLTSINIVEHLAVTSTGFAVSIPVNATEVEVKELIARVTPSDPPTPPVKPTETTTEQSWHFAGLPGGMIPQNEVLMVCSKYLTEIERLVTECETNFP